MAATAANRACITKVVAAAAGAILTSTIMPVGCGAMRNMNAESRVQIDFQWIQVYAMHSNQVRPK